MFACYCLSFKTSVDDKNNIKHMEKEKRGVSYVSNKGDGERVRRLFGQQSQGAIIKASPEQIQSMSRHQEGTVDAKGHSFWKCRRGNGWCPGGARSIMFQWCSNVVVHGLKLLNSQTIHMAIKHCNNVKIQNVKITAASGSPNTDGIHIVSSRGVTVVKSTISTGDNCISIGPGAMNLWIEQIGCGPGHGISIGSLGNYVTEEGVQNVMVTNSVLTKTQNGVRVKSWARPHGSYPRNLIMRNVGNPIIIDQKYCPDNNCPHESSGVRVSQLLYRNIKWTSLTQAAMMFHCPTSMSMRWIVKNCTSLASVQMQESSCPSTVILCSWIHHDHE